jgi:hypothetical protein
MPRMCQAILLLAALVLVTATTQEDSIKPQEASRPCTSPRIFEPGCVAANTSSKRVCLNGRRFKLLMTSTPQILTDSLATSLSLNVDCSRGTTATECE